MCTVLAMGLLAYSSVDAGVVNRKREERCAGAIVEAARNADAKGTITMGEIEFQKGKCTYKGALKNVPTSISYRIKDKRKNLDRYQGYITENIDCDPESTVCLIDTGSGMKKAQNKKRAGAVAGGVLAGLGAAGGASVASTAATIAAASGAAVTSTVLAAGAAPALVVAAPVVAIRGIQNKQCKQMCQGHFARSAHENGVNVLLDPSDIKHTIQGVGRNRKCSCSYTGPAKGFARNATFLMRKSRKEKETAELKSYSDAAHKETCNLLNETCIADIPKKLDQKQQCILAFWKHGKTNGLRGTIVEKHNVVKASKDKNNENKLMCEYTGSIQNMPPSLTIDNDPKNQSNRTTYATQMHLGNNVCNGQQNICLFVGQR
jgi:hypothetical protein